MRNTRTSGHTLIEVMTAMVLLTVAATGTISMQSATTLGTQQAQETSVAVTFAENWLERIKRDALLWTAPGNPVGPLYVSQPASGFGDNIWNLPAPTLANESYAADAYGFDVLTPATNIAPIRYCAHFRNVVQHVGIMGTDAIRVDVRIWWPRAGDGRTVGNMSTTGCETMPAAALIASPATREIFVSTVVRWRAPGP